MDGVGQAGTPVELADGNGRLAGRPAVGRKPEGREEPFGRIDPDDVRPTPDLPDRDPRNVLTDTWHVVPVNLKPDRITVAQRTLSDKMINV